MVPKRHVNPWYLPGRGGNPNKMAVLDYILSIYEENVKLFNDPENIKWREKYMEKHLTKIIVFKCMDGRCNLSVFTKIQPGILDPMREMGAQFNIGWAHLQDIILNWVIDGNINNRFKVGIFTYHFSKSQTHLGCRAFEYDTDKAIAYAKQLQNDFDEVFQSREPFGMFSVLWGMETDSEALILHGHNGQVIDLFYEINESPDYWLPRLQTLYPKFPKSVILDLFELVQGNIAHIKVVKATQTLQEYTELDHAECGLAYGRGLGWLHTPNTVIIVGPFNPNPIEPLSTAANLLVENIKKKKVNPEHGIALLTSVPFTNKMGFEEALARKKALNNSELAYDIIEKHVPDLFPLIKRLTFTINMKNWKMNILHKDK